MTKKEMDELLNFTNNLLTEFKEYLPLTVVLKLYVIRCHLQNMAVKDIKANLEELAKKKISCKNRTTADIDSYNKALSIYLNSDQKKIHRLKKITSIPQLLNVIGYANFIHAVLEKYPYPSIVGFPRRTWTKKLLLKYIRLYFRIPRSKKERDKEMKLPALKTIYNEMITPHIPYTNFTLSHTTFKDIIRYYVEQTEYTDFYYLLWEKNRYKVSSKDKEHAHKSHRYNTTFLAAIINMSTLSCPNNKVISHSYNSKSDCINWNCILDKLSDIAIQYNKKKYGSTSSKIVILLNSKNISMELKKYLSCLQQIPNFSLITFKSASDLSNIFDNLEDEYNEVTNIPASPINDNFKKIIDATSQLSNSKLTERIKKPEYITNLKNVLLSLKSDNQQNFDYEDIDEYLDL